MAAPDLRAESRDGTSLGVFVDGDGPPLLLVHGSLADHTTFDDLVPALVPSWTTYRMDRRGFGASGDAGAYAFEREHEDVAAVVDTIAGGAGADVRVFAHSYGAGCALGGAAATDLVSHLVLYEPSLGLTYPEGCIAGIEAALARDDRAAAVVEVLSTILGMTPAEIDAQRQSPRWPDRLRAAPTIPRECQVEEALSFGSSRWDVGCPTLVMTGSATTGELGAIARAAVAAIDGAQLQVLEGQDHMAHRTAPQLVAEALSSFLRR